MLLARQRRPKSIVLNSHKIKASELRAPGNVQDTEVAVKTLTFSDSESMSRQNVGLWLLAKH